MSDIVEEVYLVKVDSNANNNKFYKMSLYEDGRLTKTWGRVGSNGQTTTDRTGREGLHRALREKTRKGYAETRILSGAADSGSKNTKMDNNRLATIAAGALSATKDSQAVADLIRRISLLNQHEILEASGGKIKVDTDGIVKTALGIVDETNVSEARRLLTELDRRHPPIDRRLLDQYLTLIPQKVPGKAGWADDFFTEFTTTKDQFRLLDQLEDSIAWYKNQTAIAKKSESSDGEQEETADYSNFFRYRIREASDAEFLKIKKKYDSDKNSYHTSSRLRPLRAFALVANSAEDEQKWTEARDSYGNVKELWHGTSGANLLSIFRRGLFVPPTTGTGIKISGRMFGLGIYLSNQSSKSLNYSTGYWHGTLEQSAFMLLTETVMGSEYRPTVRHYDSSIPTKARTEKNKFGKPYNSISVKGGYAGVINHEAIVWNTEQVALRYLVEFGN